jgi:drug/metabolite transporter (DMT)-like permease
MLGGAGFAALINYLIPLWALLLGVLLLGEQPRWTALLALVLILGGIALSEARGRPGPASAPAARGD